MSHFSHSKGYNLTPSGQKRKKEDQLKEAHSHTANNRKELEQSNYCGCIFCERIFPVSEIEEFVDDDETALCPYCDIDALIGDASGIKITKELLAELNKRFFNGLHD